MDTLYKEYRKLGDSGSWLGLEPGTGEGWFCTPGASAGPRVGRHRSYRLLPDPRVWGDGVLRQSGAPG